MGTKEIKINPPEGYEIDQENSTLECIKFKPVTERWRDQNDVPSGYYVSGDVVRLFNNDEWGCWDGNHDVFATEKQAKSALAMAQISQIMANDERFGGVVTDEEWKTGRLVHTIERYKDTYTVQSRVDYYPFLAFHTPEQRDLFLKENVDLIKDYLMIK